MGTNWLFLANIIGPLVQSLYLIARSRLIHDTDLRADFSEEKRAMLDYCKPMIANSIAWWVNNTSDRYVVIFFCGLAENGIYSVASKIPSILNIFQSIFFSGMDSIGSKKTLIRKIKMVFLPTHTVHITV